METAFCFSFPAETRRRFLKRSGALIAAAGSLAAASSFGEEAGESKAKKNIQEPSAMEISPVEDLMREHGVLSRILLMYDEIISRLNQGKEFPPETLAASAELVRRFIEDYHEKLEEDHVFPGFEKAG